MILFNRMCLVLLLLVVLSTHCTQEIQIALPDKPEADIEWSTSTIPINGSKSFKDVSTGGRILARLWEFEQGDPKTAIVDNVAIRYYKGGTFKVKLTVENETGVSSKTINVAVDSLTPFARMRYSGEQRIGELITFYDISENNPTSRTWIFPMGSPSTSTTDSVQVSWQKEGEYTVRLICRNFYGSSEDSIKIFVY